MKKIGLIGGMSWESSLVYYKIINETVRDRLGGFHSCNSVMESVDFALIEELQHKNDWNALEDLMVEAAKNLVKAKAEMVVLCTNTMHLCSEAIVANVNIPFLHIATATAEKIVADGLNQVLLLGTRFTMESNFFKDILENDFGIRVMTPDEKDRLAVHRIIYEELVHGKIRSESKEVYRKIISKAEGNGAKGAVLGCTEIPLLVRNADVNLPVYDTTRIHAESAVDFALR